MDRIILYLLESSLILAVLYMLYVLILKRETFFTLNRFFLISILLLSIVFPLVSVDFDTSEMPLIKAPIKEISKVRTSYYDALEEWSYENGIASIDKMNNIEDSALTVGLNPYQVLLWIFIGVYLVGVVVCWSRTAWTLQWIYRLIQQHPKEHGDGITIVKINKPIAPFSFMKYIFINDKLTESDEFNHILAHELTHVNQRHSIDLIFVQLLASVFWFNPIIWQLIKSLKTTHEYIADNKIIIEGYSLVEYQTLLLRQLISNNSFGLVHNFNLSFIKKRITMMQHKKSGALGKVKVAFVLFVTIVFGGIIVQCNSVVDEQTLIETEKNSSNDFTNEISLPVLPKTNYVFKGDLENSLNFIITDNTFTINGKSYKVAEITSMIDASDLTEQGVIVMNVDGNQSMKMIRDVQTELRRANRRKLLYMGRTSTNEKVEMAFLLPPLPGAAEGIQLPVLTDEYVTVNDIDLLVIQLGDNAGAINQQKVYDFVVSQVKKGKSNYVVSAGYEDEDLYENYLSNLIYIQEGFNQIYQERAEKMYGKSFYELEKPEYRAVRKGIPRAISVADKS